MFFFCIQSNRRNSLNRLMKKSVAIVLLALLFTPFLASSQTVAELEGRLRKATTKKERMDLSYSIAEKSLTSNPAKTVDYAHRASLLASELGDKRRECEAINLSADGLYRRKQYTEAANRYNQAWHTARSAGLRDQALKSVERMKEIAEKQNDLKGALGWSNEMISYLKENSSAGGARDGGDAMRRMENRLSEAEAENRAFREQIASLTGQSQVLESSNRTTEAQLKEVREKTQEELSKRDLTITQIAHEKQKIDSVARKYTRQVESMTREQAIQEALVANANFQIEAQKTLVAEAKLAQKQSENLRNFTGLLAAFIFVLAVLFYMRFRAKKRTANELSSKNALIQEEQKRSDNLLLNILPPAIAEELKTYNKVAPRKYEQATVMFIDFTGFTGVSEKLTPEQLVEEIDFCFSNFDRIISQYRIEKIKTVGDAYICASGLSDMNASPSDMVKAALEIQDFLQHVKAQRQGVGIPSFEARAGIHTGPVVAGVVGKRKFAYDIWGDTVNTAARMEEACEPGRVNVSETTYWLAKYEFEWQSRGKIAAKNKGLMDMYYVTAVKM